MALEPSSVIIEKDGDRPSVCPQDVLDQVKPSAGEPANVEGQPHFDDNCNFPSSELDSIPKDVPKASGSTDLEGDQSENNVFDSSDIPESSPSEAPNNPPAKELNSDESIQKTDVILDQNLPSEVGVHQPMGEQPSIEPASDDYPGAHGIDLHNEVDAMVEVSPNNSFDSVSAIESDQLKQSIVFEKVSLDDDQPFLSEQFEDETQTVIGEGSLVGDQDIISDESSSPCSSKSVTEENIIVESEPPHEDITIVHEELIDDVAAPSQALPCNGSLTPPNELLLPNSIDVVDDLVNNLQNDADAVLITSNIIALESELLAKEPDNEIVVESELSVCGEIYISSTETAAASDSPTTVHGENNPVISSEHKRDVQAAEGQPDETENVRSTDAAGAQQFPQGAASTALVEDQPANHDAPESGSALVAKKKSSWFPKRFFCTLI